jgi:hypothetical protein
MKCMTHSHHVFIAGGGLPEDLGTNRTEHRRKSNILDEAFVAAIQQIVDQSLRSMTRELVLIKTTLQKKMSQGIHYKSYALTKGQSMNEATKGRKFAKAKTLLKKLMAPSANSHLIFFSDENNLSQDQKINRKNNWWLCSDNSEVPTGMATKFPATVMVLGIVVISNHDEY